MQSAASFVVVGLLNWIYVVEILLFKSTILCVARTFIFFLLEKFPFACNTVSIAAELLFTERDDIGKI